MNAYFYKLDPISVDLPDVIDLDQDYDYHYVESDRAEEYECQVGELRHFKVRTVDLFKTGEAVFHQRPRSIQYLGYGYRYKDDDGQVLGVIEREDLEPFYYIHEFDAYTYERTLVADIDSIYWLDLKSGIVNKNDILNLLRKCVAEQDSYCTEHIILGLLAVYFELLDHPDAVMICDLD